MNSFVKLVTLCMCILCSVYSYEHLTIACYSTVCAQTVSLKNRENYCILLTTEFIDNFSQIFLNWNHFTILIFK